MKCAGRLELDTLSLFLLLRPSGCHQTTNTAAFEVVKKAVAVASSFSRFSAINMPQGWTGVPRGDVAEGNHSSTFPMRLVKWPVWPHHGLRVIRLAASNSSPVLTSAILFICFIPRRRTDHPQAAFTHKYSCIPPFFSLLTYIRNNNNSASQTTH